MTIKENVPVKLTSLLSFIFFFSGFAALMYQVAWQRLLTVHYGVGAVSITLIVSVYMFGMGIGSYWGGLLAERVNNKITLYFLIELLIGCFGIISLPFLHSLGKYTAGSSYIISFFYMFLYLSIPTVLMGITLPLLTKIFNSLIQNFLDTVSHLYFINTLGAALGAVIASYIIISFFGLDTAVYTAATFNFILAGLIFLAARQPYIKKQKEDVLHGDSNSEATFGRIAYFLVFITGFLAIGYEIAWFRLISILVKASPYAFSSVLAVYLTGIALGSYAMRWYLNNHPSTDKKTIFFTIQFFIGIYAIAIFTGYYYLTEYTFLSFFTDHSFIVPLHPLMKIPSFESLQTFIKDLYSIGDVFIWPMVFVFVPTMFMGASFPLISLLALSKKDEEGKTIGTVYFFNIAGNVLGGIITGFLLLPVLGTELTILVFAMVGVFFALFISRSALTVRRVSFVAVMALLSIIVFPKEGQLYETMHVSPGQEYESYFEEGRDGIVMTYQQGDKVWNYINGLLHGIRPAPGYYYETIEAISHAKSVEKILIIGYGTGSITEAVLKLKHVKHIVLVELSEALINNLNKMPLFSDMLKDSRLDLIVDDGRRYLLRSAEKFDLILIDPLRSTTAYSNNLYSRQFYELSRKYLNPEGIFMVWTDEHRVMPKTIMSVFDHVRVYDFFCLASNSPIREYAGNRRQVLGSFTEEEQTRILNFYEKEKGDPGDITEIQKLVSDYPVNEDWKPVAEYYLGLNFRKKLLNDLIDN